MTKYFKTKDLPRAAFLVTKGFQCLGSIPDPDDPQGFRKLFVLQYDDTDEDRLLREEENFLNKNDQVSAIAFYRAQKILKRYINDIA